MTGFCVSPGSGDHVLLPCRVQGRFIQTPGSSRVAAGLGIPAPVLESWPCHNTASPDGDVILVSGEGLISPEGTLMNVMADKVMLVD